MSHNSVRCVYSVFFGFFYYSENSLSFLNKEVHFIQNVSVLQFLSLKKAVSQNAVVFMRIK